MKETIVTAVQLREGASSKSELIENARAREYMRTTCLYIHMLAKARPNTSLDQAFGELLRKKEKAHMRLVANVGTFDWMFRTNPAAHPFSGEKETQSPRSPSVSSAGFVYGTVVPWRPSFHISSMIIS